MELDFPTYVSAVLIGFLIYIFIILFMYKNETRHRGERPSLSLHRHPQGKRRRRKEAVDSIKTIDPFDSLVGRQ